MRRDQPRPVVHERRCGLDADSGISQKVSVRAEASASQSVHEEAEMFVTVMHGSLRRAANGRLCPVVRCPAELKTLRIEERNHEQARTQRARRPEHSCR